MMDDERREALLERDWGAVWDTLPEAPPLVARPAKSAQVTLRVPPNVMSALKAVGAAKSLPYHSLARSWIVEALRSQQLPSADIELLDEEEVATEQLNLKVEPDVLNGLKAFSDRTRRPYHRLARQWIEAALIREGATLETLPPSPTRPVLRDLMILLLHAPNGHSGKAAIRGVTRLQKLLFVIEQVLARDSSQFYAWNYGPFDERVHDTTEGLKIRGLLKGRGAASSRTPPSFAEMIATVMERAGPQENEPTIFELNEAGHELAERLRRSSAAYEQVYERIGRLRQEWDTSDLVERVYEAFPEYTDRSLIKDEVAEKRRARRRQ
jgi:hypothetical protein